MSYDVLLIRGLSSGWLPLIMETVPLPDAGGLPVPPQPLRPKRLGAGVVAYLADLVVSGRLAAGSVFPPEPELCSLFGVSRTVIRESMRLMEEKGLARIRQGQGTTVAGRDQWNLLDPVVLEAAIRNDKDRAILDDLVAVRVALESMMAREAALKMTEAELAETQGVLGQLGLQMADPDAYLVTDTVFHDVIMRASGNALARSVVRAIHAHARASNRYNGPAAADIAGAHRGHQAICERLAARDADGAAQAICDHILGSWLRRKAERVR